MNDESSKPLLDKDIKKLLQVLEEEFKFYNTLIDQINKEIDSSPKDDDSSLANYVQKLQKIKTQMDKINDKIQYFKNFVKDDNISFVYLSQIKKISEAVSIMFGNINHKFNEKIEAARTKIQLEIDQRTNSNSISSSGGHTSLIMKKLDSKMRMDVDRLMERKHEIEQIVKVSEQLLKLSQDMRLGTVKQGRVINSIENNIIISNVMTGEANEQLTRKVETQTFNIKIYFYICTFLSIILLIVIFYVYWNYFKTTEI